MPSSLSLPLPIRFAFTSTERKKKRNASSQAPIEVLHNNHYTYTRIIIIIIIIKIIDSIPRLCARARPLRLYEPVLALTLIPQKIINLRIYLEARKEKKKYYIRVLAHTKLCFFFICYIYFQKSRRENFIIRNKISRASWH
jgi:hypothetical protein